MSRETYESPPVTLESLEANSLLAPLFDYTVSLWTVDLSAVGVEITGFTIDENPAALEGPASIAQPGQQIAVQVVNNREDSVEVTAIFGVENPPPYLGDPTNLVNPEDS